MILRRYWHRLLDHRKLSHLMWTPNLEAESMEDISWLQVMLMHPLVQADIDLARRYRTTVSLAEDLPGGVARMTHEISVLTGKATHLQTLGLEIERALSAALGEQ